MMAEMGCNMRMPGMQSGMQSGMQPGMQPGMQSGMQPGMAGQFGGCAGSMSRQALMKQIYEASFAMDDVLLFLDTHPDNMEALRYYQNVSSMRRNAMDAYQRQYGPLLVDDVKGNTWSWVTEKWPWEGEC